MAVIEKGNTPEHKITIEFWDKRLVLLHASYIMSAYLNFTELRIVMKQITIILTPTYKCNNGI